MYQRLHTACSIVVNKVWKLAFESTAEIAVAIRTFSVNFMILMVKLKSSESMAISI